MLDDAASVEDTNALTGQYQALEAQYRAALIVEASDVQQAATAAPGDAGETAEIRGLLARARVSRYLLAAAGQADPGGAEAELRIALLGAEAPETMIPLDMLQSRQEEGQWEKRADSHTNIGTSYVEQQAVIMPRLFAGSAGAFMGIDRPTVAVGTASYPVLTGGVAADFRNPSVGKDSEAASFAVAQVEPARVTARYTFNYESLARMAGLEEALTVDLRMAVEDKLDAVALKGQVAVVNVSPVVEGIITALTDPTDPTDVVTALDVLNTYSGAVDGKYAQNEDMVRLLVNPETYRTVFNLPIVANDARLLRDILQQTGRFLASANMPVTASTIAKALIYKAARPRAFVQPVWRGVTLVRDPYSDAESGIVALTAIMLSGTKMVDALAYGLSEYKLSA